MRQTLICAVLFGFFGCATPRGQAALRGTITAVEDLGECAAGDYESVKNALTLGGTSWIGAVFSAIQCIPKVVRDVEASATIADAGPTVPAGLSKDQRHRLRVCRHLAHLYGVK